MSQLVDVQALCRAAITTLQPLAHATPGALAAALQPRDDDYPAVFIGDAAARARAGFAALWRSPPAGLAKPGQHVITTFACRAEDLASENLNSRQFPGGYRRIAHKLQPDRWWLRFELCEPGASAGMAYDGLVWLSDRWAWFPKPWRVLDDAS